MWTTLAVAAALASVGAADGMKLDNIRLTYGIHGPVRKNAELLPGDSLTIAFDIEGISVDPNGKVSYSIDMAVTDKRGKTVFKQDGKPLEVINTLGGKRLPAFAHLDVGLEQPPGEYTIHITVLDRQKKQQQSFSRKGTVLPKNFGLVRVTTTSDDKGQNPVAVPGKGESLWLNFGIVGFERDPSKKQPDVLVEMQVFDDQGQPTTTKPITGVINDKVPEDAPFVPGQFHLSLNRAGKFRVVLKATCQVTKKTSEVSLPLTVVSPKN